MLDDVSVVPSCLYDIMRSRILWLWLMTLALRETFGFQSNHLADFEQRFFLPISRSQLQLLRSQLVMNNLRTVDQLTSVTLSRGSPACCWAVHEVFEESGLFLFSIMELVVSPVCL